MDKNARRNEPEIIQYAKALQTLSKLEIPILQDYGDSLDALVRRVDFEFVLAQKEMSDDKGVFVNKRMISHINKLISLTYDTHELALKALFAVDFLSKKQEALENALVVLNEKVSPEALAEISKVSKQMSNMDVIMAKIQGHFENKIPQQEKKNDYVS